MPKERILITVKTYPTLSQKYGELVCTAGVREDGSWVRLYPIPFRLLDYEDRYKKFDWIETTLVKSAKDPRPESHHPVDHQNITILGNMDTRDNWRERRRLVLGKATVHTKLPLLIEAAHANNMSLAVFRPTRVLDFIWEEDERAWDTAKLEAMKSMADQGDLFVGADPKRMSRIFPKLPFKFSYRFTDADHRESELQVLDWEVGQLFWNCLKQANGNEAAALVKVREKYYGDFSETDLHFFLGTTQQYHGWATNPWVIIGVFPVPHDRRLELF
ncbi:MAG: hypothetical protein OEV28_02865 [Nitrospirota bacterium]|nr:hypothetical protein [Nitrospirota bacterium]